MSLESSGKPDAWKLARPVWGWGRGEIPRPTPPCLVEFRPDLPGTPDRYTLTNQDGAPVVRNDEIEKAMKSMERLANDEKRSAQKRLLAWERIYRRLSRFIPSTLPPLPPFQIVDR